MKTYIQLFVTRLTEIGVVSDWQDLGNRYPTGRWWLIEWKVEVEFAYQFNNGFFKKRMVEVKEKYIEDTIRFVTEFDCKEAT